MQHNSDRPVFMEPRGFFPAPSQRVRPGRGEGLSEAGVLEGILWAVCYRLWCGLDFLSRELRRGLQSLNWASLGSINKDDQHSHIGYN